MTRVKSIAAAGALAVLAVGAANLGAQGANTQEVTYLTFSHPVELPGVRLEPGTYEFRMADVFQKDVIQVLRKDNNEVIGQWTYVQAERPRASGETVVMFRETAEGTTPAVQYWYYPGESVGKEFIYPEDQAERIAARTGQRVRTEGGYVSGAAAGARTQESDAVGTTGARDSGSGAAATSGESIDDAERDVKDSAEPVAPAPQSRSGIDPEIDAEADVDARAGAQAEADEARASNAPSAFARPSAPAGSTTGVRTQQPAEGSAQVDAQLEAEPSEPEVEQRAATQEQPSSAGQLASRQESDPDRQGAVGTSGAQDPRPASTAGRPSELPRTASPLALTGIIGLLSLAGAAGLRLYR